MKKAGIQTEGNQSTRWLFAKLAVFLVVFLALMLFLKVSSTEAPAPDTIEESVTASTTIQGTILSESSPNRLRIPKVNIDTTFEKALGLNEDKTVEVPVGYEQVGWYKFGPTPGELGPAVILGHVDSVDGPAVFWSLGQLTAGDEIFIDREDGSTARFVVTELKKVSQNDFPSQVVYGDIDHAGLRLITCSGTFNRGAQRYSHNLIVFAKLAEEPTGEEETEAETL